MRASCSRARSTPTRRCASSPTSPCRGSPTGAGSSWSTTTARCATSPSPTSTRSGSGWPTSCASAIRSTRTPRPGVPNVIRTGRSELYSEIADEMLAAVGAGRRAPADHARAGAGLGDDRPAGRPRAARSAPSRSSPPSPGVRYDEHDLELAEDLARRAALAIDNSMLFKREHEAAVVLQRSLLPQSLPELEGIDLAARYEPAAPGLEVGGDWYEVVALDDGTRRGDDRRRRRPRHPRRLDHGPRAPGAARGGRRGLPARGGDQAARRHDQGVRRARRWRPSSTSTTTPRPRSPSTCAPAIRRRCCGSPTATSRTSTAAAPRRSGSSTRTSSASTRSTFPRGSLLLLYTDGLIERRGDDLLAGLARLREVFSRAPAAADACLAQIAEEYRTDQIPDDVAMLAFATGRPGSEADPRAASRRAD